MKCSVNLFLFFIFFTVVLANIKTVNYEEIIKLDRSKFYEGSEPALAFIMPPNCQNCTEYETLMNELDIQQTFNGQLLKLVDLRTPWLTGVEAPVVLMVNAERILPYRGVLKKTDIISTCRQFSSGVQSARLDDSNFEHDTQAATGSTTGNWLIVFDTINEKTLLHYDGLANTLRARGINIGVVDNELAPRTAKRFNVSHGTKKMLLLQKGFVYASTDVIDHTTYLAMIDFAVSKHTRFPKTPVPRPVMLFDEVVDFFVFHLKRLEQQYGRERLLMIAGIISVGVVAILGLAMGICYCCCWRGEKQSVVAKQPGSESARLPRASVQRKAKKE